jgi:hypothetical protein
MNTWKNKIERLNWKEITLVQYEKGQKQLQKKKTKIFTGRVELKRKITQIKKNTGDQIENNNTR